MQSEISGNASSAYPPPHDREIGLHSERFEVLTMVEMRSPALLACCLLRAGFLLGLFFNPEDRREMFLRKID
jgi:hypothetical protein